MNRLERAQHQRQTILDLLADGETYTFRQIGQLADIPPVLLERRLSELRKAQEVEFLGRGGNGDKTNSNYRLMPKPGTVPAKFRDYPTNYLQWGGWAA
jgi:hypothetical protein